MNGVIRCFPSHQLHVVVLTVIGLCVIWCRYPPLSPLYTVWGIDRDNNPQPWKREEARLIERGHLYLEGYTGLLPSCPLALPDLGQQGVAGH